MKQFALSLLLFAPAALCQDLEQPPVVPQPKPPVSFPQGTPAPDSSVQRVGGHVTAPAVQHKVAPDYTKEARRAHIEGTVILYGEVAPDGKAKNIRVVRSLDQGLDEKAIEAVRKWKFRPGMKDGTPVTVAATFEVNFRLLGNSPAAGNSTAQNQMLACSFAKTNCLRIPIAQPQPGQMIQLSATQFAVFDSQGWHIADVP
jgi:TonB family protein